MSENDFISKQLFDDFEIITKDNIILYTSKAWLYNVSQYFKEILVKNFNEGNTSKIKLDYDSNLLLLLLKYIKNSTNSVNCQTDYFQQIKTNKCLAEVIEMCQQFKLEPIKNEIDKYFANEERIKNLFNVQLFRTANQYNMDNLKLKISNLLNSKFYWDLLEIPKLQIDDLYSVLMVLPSPNYRIDILKLWTKNHDPTDEELEKYNIFGDYDKYTNLDTQCIYWMSVILRNITKAPKTKCKIYDQLFQNEKFGELLIYGYR